MLFNLFFVLNSPIGKELQVVLEKLNIRMVMDSITEKDTDGIDELWGVSTHGFFQLLSVLSDVVPPQFTNFIIHKYYSQSKGWNFDVSLDTWIQTFLFLSLFK